MSDQITSENEEQYFKRMNAELRKKKKSELNDEELEECKQLHQMHCPKCGYDLHPINKFDVEIDVCPGCEGIWFDKGEFERVVDSEISNRTNIFNKIKKIFD